MSLKEFISLCGFIALLFYLFFFMGVIILSGTGKDPNICTGSMTRFEILFPARQIGCWLGKPL